MHKLQTNGFVILAVVIIPLAIGALIGWVAGQQRICSQTATGCEWRLLPWHKAVK